jgi:hypothetical protein
VRGSESGERAEDHEVECALQQIEFAFLWHPHIRVARFCGKRTGTPGGRAQFSGMP